MQVPLEELLDDLEALTLRHDGDADDGGGGDYGAGAGDDDGASDMME